MSRVSVERSAPSANEAARLDALESFDILDTGSETAFDDIVRIAAQVCQAPMAIVSFLDEHRQWVKAGIGISLGEIPRHLSFCNHAILQDDLLIIPDAMNDARYRDHPFVVGEPYLRFYAGAPIATEDGLPLGILCVVDRKPRPEGLSQDQPEILMSLARAVMNQLKLRQAHRILAEREGEFTTLADTLPQIVWSTGADGNYVYSNRRWYEYTGASPGVTKPKAWAQLLHPDDRQQCLLKWEHSVQTGEPYENEFRLRHRSGEYRWLLGRALPVCDEKGRISRWFGTCTEIDAWKKAEQALTESEQRYRALIEASAVIVWRAAADGSIIEGSSGWESFCGQGSEDFLGYGWLDVVHPDDRERVIAVWQAYLASPRPVEIEYRVRERHGDYRWVLARGAPLLNSDGAAREWVGTITDIHDRRQAEEALRASEERLRLATESTLLGIWDVDLVANRHEWSPETRQILGLPADAPITGESFLRCVHPDDRSRLENTFYGELSETGSRFAGTYRILRADNGEERWVSASGRAILNDSGKPIRKLGTIQDITEQKLAEDALRASEERLRLALHAGRMVAWEQDLKTNYVTRSLNSVSLLGIGSGFVSDFLDRVHPDDRPLRDHFLDRIQAEGTDDQEFRYLLPNGKTLWLGSRGERADGNRIIGVTFDITDRKAAEEDVWRAANHDALTQLPNRALFQRHLEQALARAKKDGTSVSLLMIDLDDFKDINDTLGHDAGDALLKETAARLSAMVRECDTVARLGGDEFAVLLIEPLVLGNAVRFAEILIEELRRPFKYKKRTLSSRASIGVAAFPDHHARPAELMKDADIALYRAKAMGRSQVVTYSPAMRREIEERVALSRDVREAIAQEQIVPYYQPKVCLSTGRITGFEALARWRHPTLGMLTPATFGAAFDDPEVAIAIGGQMIARVAADMRRWLDMGLDIGHMALNLSSAEFQQLGSIEEMFGIFKAMNVPAGLFEVEVTETVFIGKNSGCVSATMRRLHEGGVRVALDDFGTGYASLTHLKQFPVDHVKIDQSFIRDMGKNMGDEAIIEAVIGLGKRLNLEVTAEGVETVAQANRLRELGCHSGQGYFYARPMPGSDVPGFLSGWPCHTPTDAEVPENTRK